MKTPYKQILILIFFILIIGFIYFSSLLYEYKEYNEKMRKVTHIVIYFNEKIEQLKSVDFFICDSIYNYSYDEISDTICENISISDKTFPCPVKMRYNFTHRKSKEIVIDSFNCAGCSGTNIYEIGTSKVVYKYHP